MASQDRPAAQQETSPALDPMTESENLYPPEYEAEEMEVTEPFAPAPAAGGGIDSFLLLFTGFCMVGGGVALAAAPQFSWKLVQIGQQLEGLGFNNGVFVVGGFILFGLGLIHRSVLGVSTAPLPPDAARSDDFALVAEQLATDLAHLRHTILQVSEEVSGISESQARVIHQTAPRDSAEADSEKQNAMFALAASMDQLNARVDERMHHLDVHLRSQFDRVEENIAQGSESTCTQMNALASQMQAKRVDASVPLQSSAPSLAEVAEMIEPVGYEDTEELEILVDLDDEPDADRDDALEFFETLEELDEIVNDVERSSQAPALDLDGLNLEELGLEAEAIVEHGEPESPMPTPPESPVEDYLEALLPDDSIQRSLDSDRE
jgi:hypothetical protein